MGKESVCYAGDIGDRGLIPGFGFPGEDSPGEENGHSLQYSCLEIP